MGTPILLLLTVEFSGYSLISFTSDDCKVLVGTHNLTLLSVEYQWVLFALILTSAGCRVPVDSPNLPLLTVEYKWVHIT